MNPIKVLIADDHRDFRKVVHKFLDGFPTVDVVGEAVDGEEVIRKVGELTPDLVLMDIAMPHRSGLEATRIIKRQWPHVKVIITTMHDYPVYRMQAQEVKADQFILKSSLKPSLESYFGHNKKSAERPPASFSPQENSPPKSHLIPGSITIPKSKS